MIGLEQRSIEKYGKIWDRSKKMVVEHKSVIVTENDKCKILRKILWDFIAQTDHEVYGRRLYIQKDKNLCQIIVFAYPCDGRVDTNA